MTTQFQLLNKILKNGDFSVVIQNNLTSEHFFGFVKEFEFIRKHYETYKAVPDRLTFLDAFPDFDIVDVAEPDSYLVEQVFTDYNAKCLAGDFNELRVLLEKGKVQEAMAYVATASQRLHQGTAMTCVDLMQDRGRYDRYLDRYQNRTNHYLQTGFPELDTMIGGIDRMEENMVIAARTGVGKSWTLIKIAVEAAKQDLRVGIYSGEMSADKVGYRMDTLLGHIDNKSITRCADTDPATRVAYEHYMDQLPHQFKKGCIKVLTPNDIQGPATVNALRMFVEKEKLDILLIDQYSLLEDQRGAKTTHEKVANISKDVKNLQVMSRIPIVSVSQMNRTKNEDGEQDTTQIGLSDRIGQDATTIIMLSRDITYRDKDKTQIQDEKLILNVVKSRDGGSGKLMYKADFNTGHFIYLDPRLNEAQSENMRSYYEDEGSEAAYDDSYGGVPF